MLLFIPSRVGAPPNLTRRILTGAGPLVFRLAELLISIAPIDGARAGRLSYRVEPLGRRRDRTGRGALRHALAPTFRAGAMLPIFIPSRAVRRRIRRGEIDRRRAAGFPI